MSVWQSQFTDAHLRFEPLQDVGSLSWGLYCGWDMDPLSLQVLEAYFPKPCSHGTWSGVFELGLGEVIRVECP